MFGDISACFYQYLAGIVPDAAHPGFSRVTLRPIPVTGLEWVKAWHRAPAGIIRSGWRRDGGALTFDVTLPEGTAGELHLPDGQCVALAPGVRGATFRVAG
jgi:alpha-L-rhamnosidase